jgi:hypothetical protein
LLHGKEFGRAGLLNIASSSFGLQSTIDAGESIQHLLISCIFARQVWVYYSSEIGLSSISPVSTSKFLSWWYQANKDVPKEMKKGLNSLITLVAWEI